MRPHLPSNRVKWSKREGGKGKIFPDVLAAASRGYAPWLSCLKKTHGISDSRNAISLTAGEMQY